MIGRQLVPRVESYLHELVRTCAEIERPLVSVVLFGSAASGGFSSGSDVDLLIVVRDETTREGKRKLRSEVTRLEIAHGFRPAPPPRRLQARIERVTAHLKILRERRLPIRAGREQFLHLLTA